MKVLGIAGSRERVRLIDEMIPRPKKSQVLKPTKVHGLSSFRSTSRSYHLFTIYRLEELALLSHLEPGSCVDLLLALRRPFKDGRGIDFDLVGMFYFDPGTIITSKDRSS